MFDPRNNLANEVSAQLIAHFADRVFRTVIPRNIRLAEAPSFGRPALLHDKESRGALAYLALAGEMIRREDHANGIERVTPQPEVAAAEPPNAPAAAAHETPAPAAAPQPQESAAAAEAVTPSETEHFDPEEPGGGYHGAGADDGSPIREDIPR
jgi:hypothetical protein